MNTVLVTGAGGFVGSAIVRCLVGAEARFSDGAPVEHVVALLAPDRTDERLAELERDGTWSTEHADVADRETVGSVFQQHRPRAVVHAHLDHGVYARDDEELVRRPLANLLEGLSAVRRARILLVGSAWVLAPGDRLRESAPVAPGNAYARNKAAEEALLVHLAEAAHVPWVTLRLFNLFGRFERPTRLIPSLVARLSRGESAELTHGEQVRDFNDVDVAARAFAHALAAPDKACGAVYHIGSGRGTRVRDLALAVAEIVGNPTLIRFGVSERQDDEVPVLVSDPRMAKTVLGWRPDTDLDGRLRAAVDWWVDRLERREAMEVRP